MTPKHRLTISEIEDEEDIQERKARRKARKLDPAPKKHRVSLSYLDDGLDDDLDDDLEPQVMLFKKVKHVENKRNHVSQPSSLDDKAGDLGPGHEGTSRNTSGSISKSRLTCADYEDTPMVVESDQLKTESSVESIPFVDQISRVLVSCYESLGLHHLFSDTEENCKFRLYLYAVAFGHTAFWPRDPVMISVLKRVLTSQEVHMALESAGIRSPEFSQKEEKVSQEPVNETHVDEPVIPAEILSYPVVRYSEDIEVPKRVMRLLP